jgi:diguanylate cyclase (GGDEF)-like protein
MLSERVEAALVAAEAAGESIALMILDLDDFKAVNDMLGHDEGDRLLRLVAPRLTGGLGEPDLLARLGGDEFAVLLDAPTSEGAAETVARNLLAALEAPFEVDGLELEVRASAGVSVYPDDGRTATELLRAADGALYAAKASSAGWARARVQTGSSGDDPRGLARSLGEGIERGELVVHYQPKVLLSDGRIGGVEALVRWRHPTLGLLDPDRFVPLAERTGLIGPLTRRVLDTALSDWSAWRAMGAGETSIAVNVSLRCLLDRSFPATVAAALIRHDVPPQALQLEVTESRHVADVPRARLALVRLREAGVGIAIDDFGTGYSSLAQLRHLPVDEIKIDRSFVRDMNQSSQDAALVRSTIELGRSLGLRVTAEGVETEDVRRSLVSLGCGWGQGFHFARPETADACLRRLRDRPAGRVSASA